MMSKEREMAPSVKAVLCEINDGLQRFVTSGETFSIFTNKMSLTPEEREEIRDFLGQGSITIKMSGSAEPAEWMESSIPGIWYGVFYDQSSNPVLETIEIGAFPLVPSAQIEDIHSSIDILRNRLTKIAE